MTSPVRKKQRTSQPSTSYATRGLYAHLDKHYLLHIRLDAYVEPVIWREVPVPGNIRMGALEWWIKGAFDWAEGEYHLGEFTVDKMEPVTAVSGVKRFEVSERKELNLIKKAYGRDFEAKQHEVVP